MTWDSGINEIETLLNTEDPGIALMDERTEQNLITTMHEGMEVIGNEAFVDLVFSLVEEAEERLRATDSPAARYCLEWLEEERARRERGF